MRILGTLSLVAGLAVVLATAPWTARPTGEPATAPFPDANVTKVASETLAASDQISDETAREATAILEELQGEYEHLEGVTISVGSTPEGHEAVAYYTDGEILINPEHQVQLEKILAHEIWHIIDWRDNGRLDWGEDLPPRDASGYRL